MTKHSILEEFPEVLRDKVRRALRNIPPLSDERHEELDATMTPPEESLDELRRICARTRTLSSPCSVRTTRQSLISA
jgi:hypothetical protein